MEACLGGGMMMNRKAIRAGARISDLITVEDVMIREKRIL